MRERNVRDIGNTPFLCSASFSPHCRGLGSTPAEPSTPFRFRSTAEAVWPEVGVSFLVLFSLCPLPWCQLGPPQGPGFFQCNVPERCPERPRGHVGFTGLPWHLENVVSTSQWSAGCGVDPTIVPWRPRKKARVRSTVSVRRTGGPFANGIWLSR